MYPEAGREEKLKYCMEPVAEVICSCLNWMLSWIQTAGYIAENERIRKWSFIPATYNHSFSSLGKCVEWDSRPPDTHKHTHE